jgi:surface carbohydrate biosynthesis protein
LAQKDPVKRDADGFVTTLPDATGTLAEFTHRFCKKYKLKIVFASRCSKFSRERKKEEIFYKIYLKNYNFKLARLRNKYSTYIYVMKSRVVIGLNSSIVREALGLNKKIFHCNFTGFSGFNYPTKFKFSLNKNSYAIFEKELLKILAMSNLKYFKTLGKEKNLVMCRCDKTLGLVRNKVAKYLLS